MTQPRSFANSTILLRSLSIPVKIYTAASRETVEFTSIHKDCGAKLTDRRACPAHGDLTETEIAKGFEVAPDQYLELNEDELEEIKGALPPAIHIHGTVLQRQVPAVAFEKSYYLGPNKGGDFGFAVLREALARRQVVALADSTIRGKRSLAAIGAYGDVLVLHHLFFATDIREPPTLEKKVELSRTEIQLATKLIDELGFDKFDHSHWVDEQVIRAKHLLERRAKGERRTKSERVMVDQTDLSPVKVIDLRTALEQSLAQGKASSRRKAG